MPCFYCGKPISVIRKLTDPDFCCDEHRERYHELAQLAIQRLMEASPAARKPKEGERAEAVAAARPEAHPAEAPREKEKEEARIPAAAGLRELAWSGNKDVASCFAGSAAASFAATINLPRMGWSVKSGPGLPLAMYAGIRPHGATGGGGATALQTVSFAAASLLLPSGPSPKTAPRPLEATLTMVEARSARRARPASRAARALRHGVTLSLKPVQTPTPSSRPSLVTAPAIGPAEPGVAAAAAEGELRAARASSARLSMPATAAYATRWQTVAGTMGIEPGRVRPAPGRWRAARTIQLAPKAAWPAPSATVLSSGSVRIAESLTLMPAPARPTAAPLSAAHPNAVGVVGLQREPASLPKKAAILPAGFTSIAPRVIPRSAAPGQAWVASVAPRLTFPQALPHPSRGLVARQCAVARPPAPAALVSLGVGSGSALTVSVALPAMGIRLPELPAEPAQAPPAAVPAPGVKVQPAAPAAGGTRFPIPALELSACTTSGPAVASDLSAGAPSVPEPRLVLPVAEARLAGEPRAVTLLATLTVTPKKEAWRLKELELGPAPAVSPPAAPADSGGPAKPVVAGPAPGVRGARVPLVEVEQRGGLGSASWLDLELRQPRIPAARGGTVGQLKALPVVVCYPQGGAPSGLAGIRPAEREWLDLSWPGVVRPDASRRSAGWLAGTPEVRVGARRLGIGSPAMEACAATLPPAAARPTRIAGASQGAGDAVVGVRPAGPQRVAVPERRAHLAGLQDLKAVAPGASRPELKEKARGDFVVARAKTVIPGSRMTPRVAHSFARYPVREVGPKPRAGQARARRESLEPWWRTRSKRPAGVVSLVTVEFELPPTPPVWVQFLRVWKGLPVALRAAVASVALVIGLSLLIWAVAGEAIASKLAQRAAIELHEDFSHGLRAWMGAAGWAETWKRQPGGSVEIGQLALWRPTRKLTDYQFEFLAQVSGKTLGWVYRASDLDNYYSMKLTVVKPGPLPTVALVRSVVVAGREQEKVQVPVRVRIHQGSPVRVRVQVREDGFTTWIAEQLADYWRDDRFRQGAVGFFAETGDRAQLFWVRLTHQDDFLGKLCSYLAPSQREEYGP